MTNDIKEAFSLALGAIRQHRFQSSLTLAGIIMGVATVIVVVALIQGLDGTIKRALSRLNPSSFIVGRIGFSDMGSPDFQTLLKRRPPLTVDCARAQRPHLPPLVAPRDHATHALVVIEHRVTLVLRIGLAGIQPVPHVGQRIGRPQYSHVARTGLAHRNLLEKIRTLPTEPGVYLYKKADGEVIYVGKAKNLRSRVASYFHEGRWQDAKTGTLVRDAIDVEYIVVANNKEALALENNLIKQRKPRFNILLRDDKTYPYVKLTLGERFPRVYVTRSLRKDGSVYYGPYFPANLAYRIVDLIHRHFLIPSCKVDLTRYHPRPCLQFYIKRCLGPLIGRQRRRQE